MRVGDQLIDSLQYNELGLLQKKFLGNGLESLTNDYNVRGWLLVSTKIILPVLLLITLVWSWDMIKTTSVVSTTSYTTPEYKWQYQWLRYGK